MRAPETEQELLERARAIAGRTIAEIAARCDVEVPSSLARAKGFVGNLVERALGAPLSSRPTPDFAELGVELKTLPIDTSGRPIESTYVSIVDVTAERDAQWETSRLRAKLARILWMPVEAEASIAVAARRFGTALLWSPSSEEEQVLRADYEELLDVIAHGFIDSITAHRGTALQIRPKAANAQARTRGVDPDGGASSTLPRGFYLRPSFTAKILEQVFGPPETKARDTPASTNFPSPPAPRRS